MKAFILAVAFEMALAGTLEPMSPRNSHIGGLERRSRPWAWCQQSVTVYYQSFYNNVTANKKLTDY